MKAFVLMCALIGAAATAQARDLFICHNSDIHVVVSRSGNTLHYTAWPDGGSRSRPALRLRGGVERVEGSGVCAHPVWTFRSGPYRYQVSEGGCYSDEAPEDYTGSVTVSRNGETVSHFYCYDL